MSIPLPFRGRTHRSPRRKALLLAFLTIHSALAGMAKAQEARATQAADHAPADRIAKSTEPPLRSLIDEMLERNPDIAALKAASKAAFLKAPQVKALPDPMLGATLFALTPETRVGAEQGLLKLSQRVPWLSKLTLKEQAALRAAKVIQANLEALRLKKVTTLRTLIWEIAFLDARDRIIREDRSTLVHYETLARARYASGVGQDQAVVKLQAEITKDDERLLTIATRRHALVAKVNTLRNQPATTRLDVPALPELPAYQTDSAALLESAIARRPEVKAADWKVRQQQARIELAKKNYRPDFVFGLTYGAVLPRDDAMGRASPPDDNGQDIIGLTAGITLPIWKKKLDAALSEAAANESRATEERRSIIATIDGELQDLIPRISLTQERLDLFKRVLLLQADQALRSAEAAYVAGTLNALDLLDAERVLLSVRVATKRARADYAIALAKLEGTIAATINLDGPTHRETRR